MYEKDFGKLSRKQIRQCFSLHYLISSELPGITDSFKAPPEKLKKVLDEMPNWAIYYEIPFIHLLAHFFGCIGLAEKITVDAKLTQSKVKAV